MTILITLTTIGTDCSLFDIYSNTDGFVSAFETDVPKASLSSGFSSANVPDGTTIIRVKAKGVCTNYKDINLTSITTTTTTTSALPSLTCSEFISSGGDGVSEYNVTLDNPLGGYIVVELNSKTVPDKLEILHNGIKKATSGMTVSNGGPFDDLYGTPTPPDYSQAMVVDQFVGSDKGTIPSRQSEFASETGSSLIMDSGYQQLIWWVYSASDFSISNSVTIRITGTLGGTVWEVKRLCETTPPISTTTTTTTNIGLVSIESQQAGSDSGTWELKVINGNEGDQYKIRATASFTGEGNTILFTNFNTGVMDNTHLVRTGTLFSLDANGENIGSYTVDGNGITCLVELLDSSDNIISSTNFSTSPA